MYGSKETSKKHQIFRKFFLGSSPRLPEIYWYFFCCCICIVFLLQVVCFLVCLGTVLVFVGFLEAKISVVVSVNTRLFVVQPMGPQKVHSAALLKKQAQARTVISNGEGEIPFSPNLWNFCPQSFWITCRPFLATIAIFLFGKCTRILHHGRWKTGPWLLDKECSWHLEEIGYFHFSSVMLGFLKWYSEVLQFPLGSCWSPPNWRNSWVWAMENRWENFSTESDGAVRLVFQAAKKNKAFFKNRPQR